MASRWLQVSVTRAALYVDASLSRYGRRKHTQESIDTVHHLDSHFPIYAEAHGTWLRASESIAKSVVFVSTSTGEYQVLCRVDDAALELQNRALKLLAIAFRPDPACNDCDVVLRQPAFLNSKHDPVYPVIVKCLCYSTWNPGRLRLDIAEENAMFCPVQFHRESVPKGAPIPTTSWRDLGENLPTVKDTEKYLPTLALRRSDVPSSLSMSSPGRRCRRSPQFVASQYPDRMTLLRNLRLAMPADFRHTLLRSCTTRLHSRRNGYRLGTDFEFGTLTGRQCQYLRSAMVSLSVPLFDWMRPRSSRSIISCLYARIRS
jgi:RepB DNA-primase from phage plasmid